MAGRRLTRRQREILELRADGLSPQQIGLKLGIKYQTVKNHLYMAYDRLELERRCPLVAIIEAVRTGQITLG